MRQTSTDFLLRPAVGAVLMLAACLAAGCSVSARVEAPPDEDAAKKLSSSRPQAATPSRTPQPAVGTKPAGPAGGTLRLGLGNEPLTLDPAEAVDHEAIVVCENIFDTLVRYSDGSTNLEPALAESWVHTKDELTWIFELRDGVKFHDGTAFNADAVAFSFRRQMDPAHPYKPKESLFWKRMMYPVREVRVLDARRISIELERPYGPLLAALAMPQCGIVSPDAVKKQGLEFAKNPVGSGPFKIESWGAGMPIKLAANAGYWATKPLLAGAVVRSVPDPAARLLQLARGDLDAIEGVGAPDLAFAEKSGITVDRAPGLNVVYLAFNTLGSEDAEAETTVLTQVWTGETPSPLRERARRGMASVRIRKALVRGIDKSAICTEVYGNLAVPAVAPVPPTMWGAGAAPKDSSYDPVLARQLLEQAGYDTGFSIELLTLDRPRSYLPEPRKLAHQVRKDLTKLGIDVRVRVLDFDALQELVQNGDYEACLAGWTGDTGDPDNFLYTLLDTESIRPPDSTNLSFFNDPKIHELLLEGQGLADRAAREAAYTRAQELIAQNVPILPLVHLLDTMAYRSGKVSGLKMHPVGFRRLAAASLAP